jgi:ribonuclease Z
MAKLIILGTSNAIADAEHANTHMALVEKDACVLVDCSGTPNVRLNLAGLSLDSVDDLVLTHFHPDHVSAVPLFLMNLWLMGRSKSLRVYGLHHTLERIEDLMSAFRWDNWPNFFQVAFHRLPERERVTVLERETFRIISSPVRHYVPTIGLRFENSSGSSAIAYSCDTEPCPSVVRLAEGAQVLIHEASGAGVGHSSASQAGGIARDAGVEQLLLIHYPTGPYFSDSILEQARETFSGNVRLAEDLMEIALDPSQA